MDMRKLFQYLCLIWTYFNQKCEKEHLYTYISHYWHMPLNKYTSHITHRCPTALLLWSTYRPHIPGYTDSKENSILQILITMLFPYLCQKQISPSYATHTNYSLCIYKIMSVYVPDMNSTTINNVTTSTSIHTFTLLACAPEQICQPHCTYTFHYILLWSTYRCNITLYTIKKTRNCNSYLPCYIHIVVPAIICPSTSTFMPIAL